MWRGPRRVMVVCGDRARRLALVAALAGFDVVEAEGAFDAGPAVDASLAVAFVDPEAVGALRALVRERAPAARLIALAPLDGDADEAVTPDAAPGVLRLTARLAVERAAAEDRRRVAEDDRWALAIENGALRSFSYSAAHDLRTPLRHVASFADELLEEHGARLDAQGRALARHIVEGCVRLDGTLEQLLRLSRADRADVERQRIDLSALMRSVVEETKADGASPLELVCPDGLEANADPHLLRLALLNLVSNARKFTRHQNRPRVEFGCDARGGDPVYFVADNGVGFGGVEPAHLFRPFFQAHDPGAYGGCGVGLAITARVIARHGGHIRAESPPHGGAVFRFTLGQTANRDREAMYTANLREGGNSDA